MFLLHTSINTWESDSKRIEGIPKLTARTMASLSISASTPKIEVANNLEEMDKPPRNVKCGNNSRKFSNTNKRRHFNKQQSGKHKLFGDNASEFSENSKKKRGKIRSLRAVTVSSTTLLSSKNMGCHVSDRFKIHNTFFNDCNGVYHAYVPRKLRSAMKKRSRKSILIDSEKVNQKINGIESAEKDMVKKSKKQGINQNWTPRESASSGPITKDEEEVAETLFALAEMFPHSDSNHNSKELVGESLLENSVLQDLEENTNASLEVSATGPCQNASPCPEEASKCLPGMVKLENCNKVSLHDSELCLAIGSNMTRQSIISQSKRELDVELGAAKDDASERKQHLIKEQVKNEGLALWPGLSTVASTSHAYQQSFAAKVPDWLEPAMYVPKQDLMKSSTCSSSGKISEVAIHKRSWKRCAAHVYISHIIQSFEAPKKEVPKESKLNECNEMRAHEGSKCGTHSEVRDLNLNGMRNGVTCATVRNHNEIKNGILQQQMQCHYSNLSHAAPRPVVCDPQKQSFNFLSLSAGSYGAKVDNNCNQIGSRLQQLSQLQIPYFQSLGQQQRIVPIPTPRSHYASTFYLDQPTLLGPQLPLQQLQYYGSPLCGTQYSSTVSNKQELKNFWEVQQAAQVRSSVNCNIMRTQHPNWQNGTPCAQAIFPHSPASQEIFAFTGQQKQLIPPIQDKWARSSSSSYYM